MAQSSNQGTGQDTPCDPSVIHRLPSYFIYHHTVAVLGGPLMTSATEVWWIIKYKHKETNSWNVKSLKESFAASAVCFTLGKSHLFPALSLTSLARRRKLGHHMNPHFNNFVAKQFNKPYPSHKYLSRTDNLKINTGIIHLLSIVIQTPMLKNT